MAREKKNSEIAPEANQMADTATQNQTSPPVSKIEEEMNEEGIVAKKPAPRDPIPAGNHFARCVRMILVGTIDENFNGSIKHLKKVRIGWELPTELRVFKEGEEEKPCFIEEEYTLSMSGKANLRKTIDAWRGKPLTEQQADAFDITVLLGVACLLNVVHKPGEGKNIGKTYEKIASIAPTVKGMPSYERINEIKLFNYTTKHFDVKFVEGLPDFIKNKIKSSDEWKIKMEQGIVAKSEVTPSTTPVYDENGNEAGEEQLPF